MINATLVVNETDAISDICVDFMYEANNIIEEMFAENLSDDIKSLAEGNGSIFTEEDDDKKEDTKDDKDDGEKKQGFFRRIWEAIKKAFRKVIDFFKDLFGKVVNDDKKKMKYVESIKGKLDEGVKKGITLKLPSKITSWDHTKAQSEHERMVNAIQGMHNTQSRQRDVAKKLSSADYKKALHDRVLNKMNSWTEFYADKIGSEADVKLDNSVKDWALKNFTVGAVVKKMAADVEKKERALEQQMKKRGKDNSLTAQSYVAYANFLLQGYSAFRSTLMKGRSLAWKVIASLKAGTATETQQPKKKEGGDDKDKK